METTVIAVLLSAIYPSTFYIDAANNIHNSRLLANQRKIAVASIWSKREAAYAVTYVH